MDTYIHIESYSNGRLLTARGGSTPQAPGTLALEAPPDPHLNIQLGGQKWSFQYALGGSGAYSIVGPADACIGIPVISLGQEADKVEVETKSGSLTQLWYLFADTHGRFNATGQPYCFVMSAQCMNSVTIPKTPQRYCPYTKVLDVKGNSTEAGAAVDAYPIKPEAYSNAPSKENDNQLWSPGSGEVWPVAPYSLPPDTGLQGNSNYFIGNDVVDIVRSAKVTVVLEGDLICDKGVSFQLNGFGAGGETEVWQQYSIILHPKDSTLDTNICNWTLQEYQSYGLGGSPQMPIVYEDTGFCQMPQSYLPDGTTLSINLTFHPTLGTVIGVTFEATGPKGNSGEPSFKGSSYVDLTKTSGVPGSILAYQFLIVGSNGGADTTFAGGGGRITYESNELISVSPSLAFQSAWDSGATVELLGGGTGENSNMNYSFLPPSTVSPATSLTQTFQLAGYGGP